MIRYSLIIIFCICSYFINAQVTDSLPPASKEDTLVNAPDYDVEMSILDEFGFFYTRNALKFSPVFALGDVKGFNLIFEKGGFGKKFSLNFLSGYFDGVLKYATKMGFVNGESAIVTDSTTILRAAPANFRIELQPRVYMFENFGVFLGPTIGFHTSSIENKPILIAGFSSGLSLKWKRLIFDNSIGIFYDRIGYGIEDFDVSMRININLGFYWHTRASANESFE